jgi:4-amino-4-deoxy-L-arabinose transferase-like glycosyltransferase
MSTLSQIAIRSQVVPSFWLAAALLAFITLVRLVGLKLSVVDLYFDEAQYWAWSREPALGYFSKPPLLAWIIAAAEHVCGSGEACIRSPAPLFYFGTSLLVYAVARTLHDDRVALFAALTVALSPGVVFSSRIISTDVPLLFFWALALLAFVRLTADPGPRWSVVLGLALGLGALAKYAMVYFLFGIALAALLDADARCVLRTPWPWLALLAAALVFAPNVWWNLEHGLATFRHTGDNIQGGGIALSPVNGLSFLVAQFGVFGPVAFAVLLFALLRPAAAGIDRADRLMLAFAIPPLVLVTGTAFVTRALANWAAPAFVSAAIVVAAILVRRRAWNWLAASLAIGLIAQGLLLAGDALATRLHLPGFKNGNVYHRTLGWRALGESAGALARRAGTPTIVAEQRDDVASLLYYWRDQPEQVFAWPAQAQPSHHFDLTRALHSQAPEPILLVSRCPSVTRLVGQFATVEPLGSFSTPTGPTSQRTYYGFRLSGRAGPVRPLGPCHPR